MFDPIAVQAAKADAIARYPEESCGAIIEGIYYAMTNIALPPDQHVEGDKNCACRLCSFKFDPQELLKKAGDKPVQLIVHSHPDGPLYPSRADMECQIETDVPWAIIATDGARTTDLICWGDDLPIAPLIGRKFIHCVADCFALVRDTFRLGREGCAEQGVEWPFDPILLPEFPREDAWWDLGENLYMDNFAKVGFRKINMSEARSGDACLMVIQPPARSGEPPKKRVINHAALLTGNDLILHHLPGANRVSRREPVGGWARMAEVWLRYDPENRA